MRSAVSIMMSFWVSDTEGRGRDAWSAKEDDECSSLVCSDLVLADRRVASEEGGGDVERDFVDVGGEDEVEEGPPMPRCLITVLTIASLSVARASSMPSRMAAASIMRTCWCLDSRNLVALYNQNRVIGVRTESEKKHPAYLFKKISRCCFTFQ